MLKLNIFTFCICILSEQEVRNGISIETEDGRQAGSSTNAASAALMQVIPSRVGMAAPAMFIPPLIMAKLEKTAAFIKNPWLKAPATVN